MSLPYLLALCFVLFWFTPASAKVPVSQNMLGTFGHWRVYSFKESGQNVCYMALPFSSKTTQVKRSDGRLTITERPSENSLDVVSYTSGYVFKSGSSVTASIGKNSFDLFTIKDEAWTRDTGSDRKLTKAIRTNASMTLSGNASQKGFPTVKDTLDLSGSTKAYTVMAKACGVDIEPLAPALSKTKTKKPTTGIK